MIRFSLHAWIILRPESTHISKLLVIKRRFTRTVSAKAAQPIFGYLRKGVCLFWSKNYAQPATERKCRKAEKNCIELRPNLIHIQIGTIKLLFFTEKFSPFSGFEPDTSQVPSRYATNWAILAWIWHYYTLLLQ